MRPLRSRRLMQPLGATAVTRVATACAVEHVPPWMLSSEAERVSVNDAGHALLALPEAPALPTPPASASTPTAAMTPNALLIASRVSHARGNPPGHPVGIHDAVCRDGGGQ